MGGSESSTLNHIGGFRVVHLKKGSPAHLAGVELYFDHILEIDGACFVLPNKSVSPKEFASIIKQCENRTIKIVVFNSRTRAFRDLWVTPRLWGDVSDGYLGASVRYINNVTSQCDGLRVLDVYENSPASKAGLMANVDFLMGTLEEDFETLDDLLDAVNQYRGTCRDMQLSVYNYKQETVRKVFLRPDSNWGGEGSLGCDVGYGLLHRIPLPRTTVHPNSYTRYIYNGPKHVINDAAVDSEAINEPPQQQYHQIDNKHNNTSEEEVVESHSSQQQQVLQNNHLSPPSSNIMSSNSNHNRPYAATGAFNFSAFQESLSSNEDCSYALNDDSIDTKQ